VVGLGRIGLEVARRARGLQMEVVGFDPFVASAKVAEFGIKPAADLDTLLPQVDFLTLHIPLLPDTKDFIAARELAMLPKGARLLNVARGGIVNEQALVDALTSGHVAGAGLDVFAEEPLPPDSPLWDMDNVIITPHSAGQSANYVDRLCDLFITNLHRYREGKPLLNSVLLGETGS
jgi:D-3-phosphoglycerate dehydrogenase